MTGPAAPRRDLWVLLSLLFLCGLLFFYRLGDVGLFDVDEAVFAEAT
ncbi:MAG: hypothetical protein HY760_00985, partial [Nitrospirae bacterium]|nr:hypothetical protein [Nitrospirota bacterium]